jgi:glycosyltransferase involved in cell wall biosynthesis
MYKIADYLLQLNPKLTQQGSKVIYRELDTRGGGGYIKSIWIFLIALVRLGVAKITGSACGLHVNMAERLSLFRKGALILFAKVCGIKVVLHLHAAQLPQFYNSLPRPLQSFAKLVFGKADCVIVLGENARRFVVDELGVDGDKVFMLINGVPHARFPRRQRNQLGASYNILFMGNLMERKGVGDLIDALSKDELRLHNGWTATFAGGGAVEDYRKLTITRGIEDRVKFCGWVNQEDAAKLMAAADVLVLPSYDEGLPLVILEAMANSLAVVCTPVGEIPQFIENGRQAIFVQPGDNVALASVILRVITDDLLREKLEGEGFQLYNQKFSMTNFVKNLNSLHIKAFGDGVKLPSEAWHD